MRRSNALIYIYIYEILSYDYKFVLVQTSSIVRTVNEAATKSIATKKQYYCYTSIYIYLEYVSIFPHVHIRCERFTPDDAIYCTYIYDFNSSSLWLWLFIDTLTGKKTYSFIIFTNYIWLCEIIFIIVIKIRLIEAHLYLFSR